MVLFDGSLRSVLWAPLGQRIKKYNFKLIFGLLGTFKHRHFGFWNNRQGVKKFFHLLYNLSLVCKIKHFLQ